MIEKLLGQFGYIRANQASDNIRRLVNAQNENTQALKKRLEEAEMTVFLSSQKKELPHPVVDLGAEDPEPNDAAQRKLYVAQAAAFHHDVMKKKLLKLISDTRAQFEQINRESFGMKPSEYDLFLKGTINGLWLLHDWGDEMVNEQLANQQEASEVTEAELQALKDKQ